MNGQVGVYKAYQTLYASCEGRSWSEHTRKKEKRAEGGHAATRTYRHVVQAEVLVIVPRTGIRLSGQAGISLWAMEERGEGKR